MGNNSINNTDKFKGFTYSSGNTDGFTISGPNPECADMIAEAHHIVGAGGYANLLMLEDTRLEGFIEELHYMRSLIKMKLVNFSQNRDDFESQRNGFYMAKETANG